MSSDFLGDRRKALEESFFAEHNRKLLMELRAKEDAKAKRVALAAASGITDHAVLDSLAAQGITAETMAALSVVPLVAVAWADGSVDDKERSAALRGAEEVGLRVGDVGYQLLEGWLRHEPGPGLLDAWKGYVGALSKGMDPGAREELRRELVGRARKVAEAAGGFLGIRSVSEEEETVLAELEAALA